MDSEPNLDPQHLQVQTLAPLPNFLQQRRFLFPKECPYPGKIASGIVQGGEIPEEHEGFLAPETWKQHLVRCAVGFCKYGV